MLGFMTRSSAARTLASNAARLHTGATVAVCGLGSMGHGIVQLCASNGYNVLGVDLSSEIVESSKTHIERSLRQLSQKAVAKGKLSEEEAETTVSESMGRIEFSTDVNDLANADLIVEAIAENLDIKRSFFENLGKIAKEGAILATNTSSFSVTELGEVSGRPSHTIGLHYFNPVQLMQLVEVVCPDKADQSVIDTAVAFVEKTKKTPVQCKDTPGFIVNRLLIPYLMQATAMVARGDATAEAVDTAMRLGAGHPMGPITLADYVGHDISLPALQGWIDAYPDDPSFQIQEAVDLLTDMVDKKHLGRKTGQGFYKWEGNKIVK
jgi:3-hydroxyacyl-CoA dehydrogenase